MSGTLWASMGKLRGRGAVCSSCQRLRSETTWGDAFTCTQVQTRAVPSPALPAPLHTHVHRYTHFTQMGRGCADTE